MMVDNIQSSFNFFSSVICSHELGLYSVSCFFFFFWLSLDSTNMFFLMCDGLSSCLVAYGTGGVIPFAISILGTVALHQFQFMVLEQTGLHQLHFASHQQTPNCYRYQMHKQPNAFLLHKNSCTNCMHGMVWYLNFGLNQGLHRWDKLHTRLNFKRLKYIPIWLYG